MPEGRQWPLERLNPVLHEQDGYFTTAQAERVGVSKPEIDRILKAEFVRRVRCVRHHAQRADAPGRRALLQRMARARRRPAAKGAERPKGHCSHETAANLHGIGVLT